MSDFLFYISLIRTPESVRRNAAPGATCNFAKQQNCTVRILRALSLTPTLRFGRPPSYARVDLRASQEKFCKLGGLSHHPRALFPTANPIPRAPSFRGNPSRPFSRTFTTNLPPIPPFREPIREVPGCCSRKQRRSCRGKIIYKRQNSAGRVAATICGKLLGREGNLLAATPRTSFAEFSRETWRT